jgi:TonB family protein
MLLAAFAAVALAQGAPYLPNHIEPALVWPRPEDVERVYPPQARERGLGGNVVVICAVEAEGALKDCRVAAEDPPGSGFGPAAVELVSQLRIDPARAASGGFVRIPIRFGVGAARRI